MAPAFTVVTAAKEGEEDPGWKEAAKREKMASKKITTVGKVQKQSSDACTNSASANDSSGTNSGAKRKTKPSVKIVKSRYMQTEKKSVAKNESELMPPKPPLAKVASALKPKVGTPPRRSSFCQNRQTGQNATSFTASILDTSSVGGNVLQSTVLDGHSLCPDFDLSVIKENKMPQSFTVDPKGQKRNLELETFLLAFHTAKMENNTQKLKEEAQRNLLTIMDEVEKLRSKVISKKRQYLLLQKQKQFHDLLDLQTAALTPVAETAKQFIEDYKLFATAVDTTRHDLPVKNLHVEEDRGKFLGEAVACLNKSERALQHYLRDSSDDGESATASLKEIKATGQDIAQQLISTSSDLLELSSLVSREKVLAQQSLEEDQIGLSEAQSLFSV